jgi:hypothetical protein
MGCQTFRFNAYLMVPNLLGYHSYSSQPCH